MQLVKKTIYECFADRIENEPDRLFLKYGDSGFTGREIDNIVDKVAKLLYTDGVRPKDSIGIYGINSASWIILFLAIQRVGAVAVLVNSYFKEGELVDCILMSDMKYLLYTDIQEDDAHGAVAKKIQANEKTRHVKCFDIEGTYEYWKSLVEKKTECDSLELPKQPDPMDTACVLFTSGTTNMCKGVRLSHYSLINNAREMVRVMKWNEDDIMCIAVPLFHCFGITVGIIGSLIAGNSIVLLQKYKSISVCEAIQDNRCTILNGVPSMFLAMVRNKHFDEFDLSSLKSGIIAGSPILKEEYLSVCEKIKGIMLQPSYGLTETSPCVAMCDLDVPIEKKAISAGKIISHVDVKIINNDTGEECATGESGEIFVKGYNVTQGYLSTDPVVCDALMPDGWFKTGDIAYFDEEGFLYIVGRRKNLIIRGGENISPTEIERYIKQVKDNMEVFVFGMKSEVLQEEIVACIEGKKDEILEKKIREYLNDNISKYKIPKFIVFIDEFPRNPTGKIDEKNLKKMVNDMLKQTSLYITR